MTPPRLPALILRLLAPPRERALIEELADEFDRLVRSDGRSAARRWYWHQALASALPLLHTRRARSPRNRTERQPLLTGWVDDARQSARWIAHHLALSALVVGTLGAAASGSIAAFAIAEAAIFNPLPDPNPGTLVGAWTTGPARPQTVEVSSWPDFVDLRRGASTFTALSAYAVDSARFTGHGDPRELEVARVGEAFDALLPAPMALGRPFNASDFAPDPPRTAILQHGFWRREFGGDPAIVGRTIVLNEAPVEIVGVLPPSRLPLPLERNDLWIPLVASPKVFWQVSRGTGWLKVVGRLRPGRSPERPRRSSPRSRRDWPPSIPTAIGRRRPRA